MKGGAGAFVGDGVAHPMTTPARAQAGPVLAQREHPGTLELVPFRLGLRSRQAARLVVFVDGGRGPSVEPLEADAEAFGGF